MDVNNVLSTIIIVAFVVTVVLAVGQLHALQAPRTPPAACHLRSGDGQHLLRAVLPEADLGGQSEQPL